VIAGVPGTLVGERTYVSIAETQEDLGDRYRAGHAHARRWGARVPMTGHVEAMCCYAGQSGGDVHTIQPAAEIIAQLLAQPAKTLPRR